METFLRRSSTAGTVQAVVLDSPVLNWNATLASVVKKNKLPAFIATITTKILLMRTGIHEADLDLTQGQSQSQLPTLLFHGINDTTAPIAVSDTFAAAHATITYHRVPDAEHTQCWNVDSQVYEAALRSFLAHFCDSHISGASTH